MTQEAWYWLTADEDAPAYEDTELFLDDDRDFAMAQEDPR